MTEPMNDIDLDDFVSWITAHGPRTAAQVPPPSAKLLDMAWNTVQTHQSAQPQRKDPPGHADKVHPLFGDRFLLMAAADGSDLRDAAILGEGGEWLIEVHQWSERPEEGYVLCKLRDPTPEKQAQVEGLTGALELIGGTVLTAPIRRGRARFAIKFAALSGQKQAMFKVIEDEI